MLRTSSQLEQLQISIERESSFHEKYIALVDQEQKAMIALEIEECRVLGTKREQLCIEIAREREKRLKLMQAIAGPEFPVKLTDFIREILPTSDHRRLFPLTEKLKSQVKKSQRVSQEFSLVLNYSLGLVSSNLSIIRSATQEVQKEYTIHGLIRESVHPVGDRSSVTLREA
jgi:hypothetical protein